MDLTDFKKTTPNLFKKCNACNFEWYTRDSFMGDTNIEIIGYQAHFKELETGYFYFNHSCKSTLAVQASEFLDLYDGPIFHARLTNSDTCPGHCLYKSDLAPCPAECECAYIRELIQIIRHWSEC